MLVGRGPFDDRRTEDAVADAHLNCTPPPLRTFAPWMPEQVDQWIAQALAKDPKDRPRDAYAFLARLYELQWVQDGTVTAVDINTTVPTLNTIIEDHSEDATQPDQKSGEATYEGMTTPPIDGRTLECAPPEFSESTLGRSIVAAAERRDARDAVDRQAPTIANATPRDVSRASRPIGPKDTVRLSREEHERAKAMFAAAEEAPAHKTEPPLVSSVEPARITSEAGTSRTVSVVLSKRAWHLPRATIAAVTAIVLMVTLSIVTWRARETSQSEIAIGGAIAGAARAALSVVEISAPPAASAVTFPVSSTVAPSPSASASSERPTASTASTQKPVVVRAVPAPPVAAQKPAQRPSKAPDDGRDLLYEPVP